MRDFIQWTLKDSMYQVFHCIKSSQYIKQFLLLTCQPLFKSGARRLFRRGLHFWIFYARMCRNDQTTLNLTLRPGLVWPWTRSIFLTEPWGTNGNYFHPLASKKIYYYRLFLWNSCFLTHNLPLLTFWDENSSSPGRGKQLSPWWRENIVFYHKLNIHYFWNLSYCRNHFTMFDTKWPPFYKSLTFDGFHQYLAKLDFVIC